MTKRPMQAPGAFEKAIAHRFRTVVWPNGRWAEIPSTETAENVARILRHLRLPMPQREDEYLRGDKMFFASRYGVVVRVMDKDVTYPRYNPLILQPIASLDAGKAVVEIGPGIHPTDDGRIAVRLKALLARMGDNGRDLFLHVPFNVGLLPCGFPVVLDRDAVVALDKNARGVRDVLRELGVRKDPQHALYAPLRRSFRQAWPRGGGAPDPRGITAFWRLCEDFVREGKLIAAWDDSKPGWEALKASALCLPEVPPAAEAYGRLLAAAPPSVMRP